MLTIVPSPLRSFARDAAAAIRALGLAGERHPERLAAARRDALASIGRRREGFVCEGLVRAALLRFARFV